MNFTECLPIHCGGSSITLMKPVGCVSDARAMTGSSGQDSYQGSLGR